MNFWRLATKVFAFIFLLFVNFLVTEICDGTDLGQVDSFCGTVQDQDVGDRGQHTAWRRPFLSCDRSKYRSRVGHEDRGGHAFSGHVGDNDAHPIVGKWKEVVVVPPNLAGRLYWKPMPLRSVS